jgi:hypothetical protein
MAFTVWVEHTRDGRLGRSRLGGVPDHTRAYVEEVIQDFHAGRKPMEATLNFNGSDGERDGLRWADIKNIWTEEG